MTFDEFFDGKVKSLSDAMKFFNSKPYLCEMQQIICRGRTLTGEDCEKFWEVFKEAQKDAFTAGQSF